MGKSMICMAIFLIYVDLPKEADLGFSFRSLLFIKIIPTHSVWLRWALAETQMSLQIQNGPACLYAPQTFKIVEPQIRFRKSVFLCN